MSKRGCVIFLAAAFLWAADTPKIDELDSLKLEKAAAEISSIANEFDKLSAQIQAAQQAIQLAQARQEALKKEFADKNAEQNSIKTAVFGKYKLDPKQWDIDLKERTFKKLPVSADPKKP